MFDNNDYINSLFGDLSSSTTTTEQTEQQSSYSPQTDYLSSLQSGSQTYNPYEKDDYSTTQNFTEQQSYNSTSTNTFSETKESQRTNFSQAPLVQKSEQAVNLVKSQSKIRFETRMKTVLAVFCVIVACLMFVSVFNFIKAGKIESGFSEKEAQINTLNSSISALNNEYIRVTSDEYLETWANSNGYNKNIEDYTITIELGEMYSEAEVEDIPSNWFNDVCEFFSKLFA